MSEFIFTLPVGGASLDETNAPSFSIPTPEARVRPYRKACIHCHDRKVKCDKQSPCSNCERFSLECTFPSPFRNSSRQPRQKEAEASKNPDTALLQRIEKLEGAVQDLGTLKNEVSRSRKRRKRQSSEESDLGDSQSDGNEERDPGNRVADVGNIERAVGKLVVEEGKSRYLSGGFWGSLEEDDKDLQVILDHQSPDEDETDGEPSNSGSDNHGFPFSPANLDQHSLHPSAAQILLFWEIFTRRVDQLAKVLHKPTTQKLIARITEHPETLEGVDKATDALLFSIYFAASTSMTDDEIKDNIGGNKQTTTARYRKAAENGLMNAKFLSTQEFMTLQAFIIYLACVRWSEDTRMMWTLSGLAVRIAQSLGLHRDGKHFPKLSAFDREIRRRVWWQLHYLDSTSSEDHASDSASTDLNFDTECPLNISDSELDKYATEMSLKDHDGITEMTFCLIHYDIMQSKRQMKRAPTVVEKEDILKACYQRLESRYLSYCHTGGTLYWLAENIARMSIAREWLLLYQDQSRFENCRKLSREMKDRLFLTNLQIIERSIQLEFDPRSNEWRWLIPRSHQWIPMLAVVAELCVRSQCGVVDRAWKAIEKSYSQRSTSKSWKSGNDAILKKLMEKARAKRDQELSIESWNSLTNANVSSTNQSSNADEEEQIGLSTNASAMTMAASSSYDPIASLYTFDASSAEPSTLAPWSLNHSAFADSMGIADDSVYWNSWDQLMTDF